MWKTAVRIVVLSTVMLSTLALSRRARADWPVDDSAPLEEIGTEFGLADGPAWDGRGTLFVPDVKGQTLFRYAANKSEFSPMLRESGQISASFFNHGRLFLSDNGNSRVAVLNGKSLETVAQFETDERPNDLVVDAHQGVYVTLTRQHRVVYIDTAGKVTLAIEEIETPNGIALSPDGATLYVAAYVPKEIWAYDVTEPGRCSPGRILARMDAGPEKGADGMTVDRAGNVYCAGPADVWIWNPLGKLLARINTPTRPINCTFGDADLQSLFITCFGGLYRQRMMVSGRAPEPPEAGEEGVRPSTRIPESVDAHRDVVYATEGDRKLLADLFVPKTATGPTPTVVVVHGGGWLKGDKTKFRALALALADRGYVTAAIEYRLGGEARFPAGIHDCNAAVRFLRANAARFHVDPERIGAVGGSAGGHLVGLMATGWQDPALQGSGGWADQSSRLQAAIVMAGPMEMTTGSVAEKSLDKPDESNSNKWLGKRIDEAPEQYALADAHLHISETSAPILFMVGEHDHPERNQPSRDRLTAHGVWTGVKVYKDGKHGCWNQLPWFHDMVEDMDAFLTEQLAVKR